MDSLSLSLSHSRSGWGHRPNPFQVAPEVSWVGCEGVSWPGVPPCVIVGRTLEHQMLDRLVGAVAVWADGRAPALDPVKTYSCTREVGRASSEQDLTGDVTMSQPACTAHNDAIAPDTHGLMLYALALLSSRRGLAHAAVVSTSSRLCYIIFITCDVLTAMPPCESKDDKNVLLSAVSTFGLLNCCATFCAISCTAAWKYTANAQQVLEQVHKNCKLAPPMHNLHSFVYDLLSNESTTNRSSGVGTLATWTIVLARRILMRQVVPRWA